MKKLQLRAFQALVIVMLALGSFALTSCNDDDDAPATVTVDGINYILNSDNTCTVTVGNYMGAVSIPGGIEYGERRYQVTKIGAKAFMACTELTAVEIPNTVTYIDAYAFNGCSALTSVEFPSNLTFIGNFAFDGCALTSLNIPDKVISIGAYSFANNKFTTIYLGKELSKISWCAFKGCPIEKIYCYNPLPAVLEYYRDSDEWPFDADVIANAIVYIPRDAVVNEYAAYSDWSMFYNNGHMGYMPD